MDELLEEQETDEPAPTQFEDLACFDFGELASPSRDNQVYHSLQLDEQFKLKQVRKKLFIKRQQHR